MPGRKNSTHPASISPAHSLENCSIHWHSARYPENAAVRANTPGRTHRLLQRRPAQDGREAVVVLQTAEIKASAGQVGQVTVAAPEHQMSGTGQQAEKMCDRHRALSFWQLYWLAMPNKGGLKQLSEDNWIGFERKYYSGSGGSCQLGGAERLTGEERHPMIYIIECILWNRTGEEKKWSKMWNLST